MSIFGILCYSCYSVMYMVENLYVTSATLIASTLVTGTVRREQRDQVFRSGRGRVIRSCTTGQPITFCKLASGNDPLKLGLTEQPRDKIKKP